MPVVQLPVQQDTVTKRVHEVGVLKALATSSQYSLNLTRLVTHKLKAKSSDVWFERSSRQLAKGMVFSKETALRTMHWGVAHGWLEHREVRLDEGPKRGLLVSQWRYTEALAHVVRKSTVAGGEAVSFDQASAYTGDGILRTYVLALRRSGMSRRQIARTLRRNERQIAEVYEKCASAGQAQIIDSEIAFLPVDDRSARAQSYGLTGVAESRELRYAMESRNHLADLAEIASDDLEGVTESATPSVGKKDSARAGCPSLGSDDLSIQTGFASLADLLAKESGQQQQQLRPAPVKPRESATKPHCHVCGWFDAGADGKPIAHPERGEADVEFFHQQAVAQFERIYVGHAAHLVNARPIYPFEIQGG